METIKDTQKDTQFMDKVIDSLRKASTEMEELRLQTALGKAEASDKYEEVKKKFNLFLHESKAKMKDGKEKVDEFYSKLEGLRVQLELGKAETKDAFMAQKKKLLLAIHDLEVSIKTDKRFKKAYAFVLIEIEKFKVNLEVLEAKFDQSKETAKASFEKGKVDFKEFIDGLSNKFSKKEDTQWEHFQDEVSLAFDHLKSAFSKS